MYTEQVLDHFQNPRNAGELADADVTVEHSNPACDDRLRLQLKFAGGKIVAAKFKVIGCTPTYACASVMTEMIIGKNAEEAREIKPEILVEALGGLSRESMHASHLAAETLMMAVDKVHL